MSKENLEKALETWKEKRTKLELKFAMTASAEQKFELEKLIEECLKNISRLEIELRIKEIPTSKKESKSEAGINYSKLTDLLAAQEWEEADYETYRVMLKVAGKEKEELLWEEDIDNFPCQDLQTIDNLWVYYSNGNFGFSVQKRIYQSLRGRRRHNSEVWNKFGDQVGWRVEKKWINYKNYNFSLDAPRGHLPLHWALEQVNINNVLLVFFGTGLCKSFEVRKAEHSGRVFSSIMSTLIKCN